MSHATETARTTPAPDINITLIPDLITSADSKASIQSDGATRTQQFLALCSYLSSSVDISAVLPMRVISLFEHGKETL